VVEVGKPVGPPVDAAVGGKGGGAKMMSKIMGASSPSMEFK
jgi:hypothetical protein